MDFTKRTTVSGPGLLIGIPTPESKPCKVRLSNSSSYVTVDEEDYAIVAKYTWHLAGKGYARGKVEGQNRNLHDLVLDILPGTKNGIQTDHINGDKLDARKVNLRRVCQSVNKQNSPKVKTYSGRKPSSGYIGVSWHKRDLKWSAHIAKDKFKRFLGYFDSEIEAAMAYDRAAVYYFGSLAKRNF